MRPRISVVIPLYNKASTVCRAVRSVLTQTFTEIEIIVVDDGSTDGGDRNAAQFDDSRLRILRQENRGVSAARNAGWKAAAADWVAFLDADDWWSPTFLEAIWRLTTCGPRVVLCATAYEYCIQSGGRISAAAPRLPYFRARPWDGILPDYFAACLGSDPPICASAVAAHRRTLERVGGFEEGLHEGEDLLMWATLACAGEVAYCSAPLATWCKNDDEPTDATRPPDVADRVGQRLRALPDRTGRSFRRFEAAWQINRAVTLLRGRERSCARAAALRAMLLHASTATRACSAIALSLLPSGLATRVLDARRARARRR